MSYDALIAYVGTPKRGHARIDARLRVPRARWRDVIGLKDTKNQNIIVRHGVQERQRNGTQGRREPVAEVARTKWNRRSRRVELNPVQLESCTRNATP